MKAYVFPGQGAQFCGMGKELCENNPAVASLFERADVILGFELSKIMFEGTDEELRQTKVTQPAVFLHSVASVVAAEQTQLHHSVAVTHKQVLQFHLKKLQRVVLVRLIQ